MIRTRVCDLLGIRYPILQGGMGYMSGGELAAAVSEAGGLGTVCLTGRHGRLTTVQEWPQVLRQELKLARSLTDKPIAVNINQRPEFRHEEMVEIVLEDKAAVVVLVAGSPRLYANALKAHGVKVIQMVFTAHHAQVAEAEGVDAVIASGVDAGGWVSRYEVPTMALVPVVVDTVKIPVIAAGGIADARGLVACLALGAEGVQLGTRFVLTTECLAHPRAKEALLQATETSTAICGKRMDWPRRALRNKFVEQILEKEASGITKEELISFIGDKRGDVGLTDGIVEEGLLCASPAVGLMREIVSAGEVVRQMVEGYSRLMAKMKSWPEG